jgi:ankyrin repeat protein
MKGEENVSIMAKLQTILVALIFAVPVVGAEEIHDAVKNGDLAAVQRILAAQPDRVNAVNERGYTPLHIAAREGRVEIASFLLDKGADLEAKNPTGITPLYLAVVGKRPEVVRFFLDKGANVNAETRFQTTPLFAAAESGNVDVLRALIKRKADVNHVSPVFGSALHRAAYMDFPQGAKALLEAGADLKVKDQRGQTPLHQAAMLGRVAVATLFVEKGADLNALDGENQTPLHLAVLYGTDRSGANNSVELGFLFLEHGARIDTTAADGETLLMSAAKRGYTSLVEAVLRRGGDLRTREPGTRRTLLHIAAIRGFGDLTDVLLARGIDDAAVDAFGRRALDYAIEHGHGTVALRLVSAFGGRAEPEIGGRFLAKTLKDREAYVWVLNHRGWALKTKSHLFVFDNEEIGRKPDWPSLSNGWIAAAEISGQDVIALYSAYHAEPNTMEFIHGLENVLPRVHYVGYKDDAWRGGTKTVYIKGREIQNIGGAEITPYETHDEGNMGSLGYLIKADGLTVFYPNFFPEDLEAFKKEIDFLAGRTNGCDVALVEVTPGQENAYAAYIVEKLGPKVVIPYDRSRNTESLKALADELGRKYPGLVFGLVRDAGDRLHYEAGRLVR